MILHAIIPYATMIARALVQKTFYTAYNTVIGPSLLLQHKQSPASRVGYSYTDSKKNFKKIQKLLSIFSRASLSESIFPTKLHHHQTTANEV